jgi:hypothetical protein
MPSPSPSVLGQINKSPKGLKNLLQQEQEMLQRLLFQEQSKYRDAINIEKRRQEMKAHAEFESFRL